MKVFRRKYDKPIGQNGKKSPNELLGEFEIIEDLGKSGNKSLKLVKCGEGKKHLLIEKSVKGRYSGTKFEVKPIE